MRVERALTVVASSKRIEGKIGSGSQKLNRFKGKRSMAKMTITRKAVNLSEGKAEFFLPGFAPYKRQSITYTKTVYFTYTYGKLRYDGRRRREGASTQAATAAAMVGGDFKGCVVLALAVPVLDRRQVAVRLRAGDPSTTQCTGTGR